MHRCLLVPEISHEIIRHLITHSYLSRKPRYGPVLAVALSCKSLCEPALDVLWQSQTSLVPLLKCLPSSHWKKERQYGRYTDTWTLCSPVKAPDWTRVEFYSRRIKTLSGSFDDLHDTVWGLLISSTPSPSVLPSLLHLDWDISEPSSLSYARILLGLSIRDLKIRVGSSCAISCISLLPSLTNLAPNVQEFNLEYSLSARETDSLHEFGHFGLWTGLRSARLTAPYSLRSAILLELGRLPSLRQLVITGSDADVGYVDVDEMRVDNRFPSLECLEIESSPLWIVTFLASITHSPIKSLTITVLYPRRPLTTSSILDWSALGSAIVAACSPLDLQELAIKDKIATRIFDTGSEDAYPEFTSDHVAPYLGFANLHKVCFDIGQRELRSITDDSVEAWTAAWSALRDFRLTQEVKGLEAPGTSLLCLKSFAKNCSSIKIIQFPVNAKTVPSLDDAFRFPRSSCEISWLADNSPIRSSATSDVATFLSAIFPRIQHVSGKRDGWDDIPRLVKMCSKVATLVEKRTRAEMGMET